MLLPRAFLTPCVIIVSVLCIGVHTQTNTPMTTDSDDHMSMDHGMKMYFHTDSMVTILFYEWHVMTTGGWVGSCIVLALASVLYEGLKQFREWLAKKHMQRLSPKSNNSVGTSMTVAEITHIENQQSFTKSLIDPYHLMQTGLHFVQVTLSYALMLVVMTYSVWLFLSVVLGLTLGYYLFGWKRATTTDVNEHCH
ncbi:high affinity copper uptake protein 1-like [Saccoglossus kowalevskii]